MIYTITYISQQYKSNQKLIDCIKENCVGWAILSPSFFLVATAAKEKSEEDIKQLQDVIAPTLEPSDKIFISLFAGQAIWKGYNSEQLIKWLNLYISPKKLEATYIS